MRSALMFRGRVETRLYVPRMLITRTAVGTDRRAAKCDNREPGDNGIDSVVHGVRRNKKIEYSNESLSGN